MRARVPLLLGFAFVAGYANAIVTQDCALPDGDCTIAGAARQAHVYVGAITNRFQGPDERALLAEHFNTTTPENEMKWGVIAPTVGSYDFTDADAIVSFAERNTSASAGTPSHVDRASRGRGGEREGKGRAIDRN